MSEGEPRVLVSTEWLAERLDDPTVAVVDMRWREDGSAAARYEAAHVPGAVRLDWSSDIVEPSERAAFMLARPARFAEAMEARGIGDDTLVVAYADRHGSGPFRLWWAFRMYGHDTARILDGGLEAWLAEGRPVEPGPPPQPALEKAGWTPGPPLDPAERATAEDVLAARDRTGIAVIDARLPDQFRGEVVWFETGSIAAGDDGVARTPRGDIRAGRVPWAVNVPWASLYRDDGRLKSPSDLRAVLDAAGVPRDVPRAITYCGVGISASALLFALHQAGVPSVSLYDASWDEWGRLPGAPVARG